MYKIFLSHSSSDKNYVRKIYEHFGGDRCVFDEMTFEKGINTLVEIFKGIDKSDIFVVFLSTAALKSEWVKTELAHAHDNLSNKKLSQIFPILIDPVLNYDDELMPQFLKNEYNLHHIHNYKIACKKIDEQLSRLQMESDVNYNRIHTFFYGRFTEKKKFNDCLEERDFNGKLNHIKCLIISGIDGIGRKSFASAALKETGIIEPYYFPLSTSLSKDESIDDLIYKLSNDLGLGDYSFDQITKLGDLDSKINILVDLLQTAQKYHEIIVIEDDLCILKPTEISEWFIKAINLISNKIVLVIISRIAASGTLKDNQIFTVTLNNLEKPETFGFLREYSKIQEVPFDDKDIDYFSQMLNGYPLQIRYCVNLVKEHGMKYVKDNSYLVFEMPMVTSAKIIDAVIDENYSKEYKCLLALLANMDTVPISIIEELAKSNPIYNTVIKKFVQYTVCTYIGISGEYYKVNSILRDFILRSDFTLTDEVLSLINNNIKDFALKLNDPEYTDYLSFVEFSYYIKENLKKEQTLPEIFLYPTVYLKSIIELYNEGGNKSYEKVINLTNEFKKSDMYEMSDDHVKDMIHYYFCSALARLHKTDFDSEVTYFQDKKMFEYYYFLMGFNSRLKGDYLSAEKHYLKVLSNNHKHKKARRELVLIYINMQDYNSALDLAEQNYKEFPENIYQMQAYFDCIINNYRCLEERKEDAVKILESIERIQRTNKSIIFYQIKAKYEAYINNDKMTSIKILNEGISLFKNKIYLYRDMFDIYKFFKDISGMKDALLKLNEIIESDYPEFKVMLKCREAIYEAFTGKTAISIEMKLKQYHLTANGIKNIINNANDIINLS